MKKTKNKIGAPKKQDGSIKKFRGVRLSDDDIVLIKKELKMSLQQFIDLNVSKLK